MTAKEAPFSAIRSMKNMGRNACLNTKEGSQFIGGVQRSKKTQTKAVRAPVPDTYFQKHSSV